MNVRHEAGFSEGFQQGIIGFGGVQRRKAQPGKFGRFRQQGLHQSAQCGLSGQVEAIAGRVYAGKDDFVDPGGCKRLHAVQDFGDRDGARSSTRQGGDAEGAGVVAAVLNGNESARLAGDGGDRPSSASPAFRV